MKSIRNIFIGLFLLGGFLAMLNLLSAQEAALPVQAGAVSLADTNTDWDSLSDLEVELKAVEMTTPTAAADVPPVGTFWSAQHAPGSPAAWPPFPNSFGLAAWSLGDGVFLLDDLAKIYQTPVTRSLAAGGMSALTASLPAPADGSGTNLLTADTLPPDYGTNLWLAQTVVAAGQWTAIGSNTLADIPYEIQSLTGLAQTNWFSEGFIYGSETTNWTPLSVAQGNRTNLFLRLRSWASSDASGIPEWWEALYGLSDVDPNALDSADDGWTVYQKFIMGLDPGVFHTPPAPPGLTATYNAATHNAEVSWQPSPGPVMDYTIQDSDGSTFNIPAGTEDFTDDLSTAVPQGYFVGDPTIYKSYQIQAHYAGGDSAWSSPVSMQSQQTAISASIVDAKNNVSLLLSGIPAGTVAIRLTKVDVNAMAYFEDTTYNSTWDIPAGSFTNGAYSIPAAWAPVVDGYGSGNYTWWIQTISANGSVSQAMPVWNDPNFWFAAAYATLRWPAPFFDGRAQLKQNLIFQLRAATVDFPFNFYLLAGYSPTAYPDTYVSAGYYQNGVFDQYKPVEDNYLYRNFVFDPSELDAYGRSTTGAGGSYYDGGGLVLSSPPTYQFEPPATFSATLAALLSTNTAQWLSSYPLDSPANYLDEIGVSTDGAGTYFMAGNAKNYWGLPFVSAKIGYGSGSAATLSAGGSTTQGGYFYPETAQPQFQTVEYDFWNVLSDKLPGSSGFSFTNKSRLMILGVQQPSAYDTANAYYYTVIDIAGYAKLSVPNGYSGVYGYLQQYFDNAYMITNGVVTTNTTGFLSPYGNFFPTSPGPAALVTLPDLDTGQRGTGTVYVVSLQLDANHDGNMDLSFNGSDSTANLPYVFWANNNYDRWRYDPNDSTNYMDDVQVGDCPYTPNVPTPDCNYRDVDGNRVIPTTRDLQDFFRLWVCGIDTNLIAKLPAGSTITLNWGDVGSPNSANPTIDIFTAADPDGGIGYLTNETTATTQIDPVQSPYVGRLAPGGSIQLNAIQFANGWAGSHFILCGVSNGTGGLNLTIADASGNVLAQSTTYLQIVDIKQMYERWTVGDEPGKPPTNTAYLATEELPVGASAFQYSVPQTTNTPYILFVHGWNLETWEKDRFAESAFKRLYWQGYQGRFGEFRWPTDYGFIGSWLQLGTSPTEKDNFDQSEYQAWQSGQGLLNKLADLNAEYPGHVYMLAHSMGNIVAGEALRLAGANQVVNTYVASQSAVSAHTYDADTNDAPNYSFYYPPWSLSADTPNIYGDCFAGNNGGGAGQVISFYNTNDFALSRPVWQRDELLKPDQDVTEGSSVWYYNYNGSISDPSPWNNFSKSDPLGANIVDFDIVNVLTNRYEVMGYAAQSWTTALGATAGVTNLASLNLTTVWPPDTDPRFQLNPYAEHFYHSAEFEGDYPQQEGYWNTLLFSSQFGFNIAKP